MVSDLFLKDYKAMVSRGIEFTPADIIRLNALALKVKLAKTPFLAVHQPRALVFPHFVLREPTIGHELWLEWIGDKLDMRDNRIFRLVHAYALSRPWEKLPAHSSAPRAIRKIFAFARKHLLSLPETTLADAIDYLLHGADWTAGELPPPREPDVDRPLGGEAESPVLALLVGLKARRLPLTLDEAKQLTASEIVAIMLAARIQDGEYDADRELHQAMGDYVRAREEIRARGVAKS
ncbi:MAG: hypothetical protein IKO64_05610 [Kiritimatiellae bacterium]|nr:hypothetical protein [Kiritimatiellia bacterium]